MFWKKKNKNPIVLQSVSKDKQLVELYWLFMRREHDKTILVESIINAYSNSTIKDFIEIDVIMRSYAFYRFFVDLRNSKPEDFLEAWMPVEFKKIFLCLSTLVSNGFFREKSLRMLMEFNDGQELPFLFLRANDWVPQIRNLAIKQIQARIISGNKIKFINNYVFMIKLRNAKRNVNNQLCDQIDQLLITSIDYDNILNSSIQGEAKNVLVKNIIINGKADFKKLNDMYLIEREPFLKLAILNKILGFDNSMNLEFLTNILQIKTSLKCKLVILKCISGFDFELIESTIYELLFSRYSSIRKISRDLYSQFKKISFRDIYLNEISNVNREFVSLIGIGETGQLEDISMIEKYLISPVPKYRKQAIIAIAKLQSEFDGSRWLPFLGDSDPSVSTTTRKLLQVNGYFSDLDVIEELYNSTSYEHVGLNAMRILISASKWDSVYYILKYINSDKQISKLCQLALAAWNQEFNRSYIQPSQAQITKISEVLQSFTENQMNSDIRNVIFSLRVFKH